jgi:hypothetical protein
MAPSPEVVGIAIAAIAAIWGLGFVANKYVNNQGDSSDNSRPTEYASHVSGGTKRVRQNKQSKRRRSFK